ncbi:hypothetical protein chiPu_0013074 [Chiloscyllium punctatum]|uniref:Uncharacterized protein n=1 Tax=Chiloscyllium punctatum TaxID=137246 RepID=A0A401SW21_CHIPU|nr:hypothetical protein [Chiloscyllium punctatum]
MATKSEEQSRWSGEWVTIRSRIGSDILQCLTAQTIHLDTWARDSKAVVCLRNSSLKQDIRQYNQCKPGLDPTLSPRFTSTLWVCSK